MKRVRPPEAAARQSTIIRDGVEQPGRRLPDGRPAARGPCLTTGKR